MDRPDFWYGWIAGGLTIAFLVFMTGAWSWIQQKLYRVPEPDDIEWPIRQLFTREEEEQRAQAQNRRHIERHTSRQGGGEE